MTSFDDRQFHLSVVSVPNQLPIQGVQKRDGGFVVYCPPTAEKLRLASLIGCSANMLNVRGFNTARPSDLTYFDLRPGDSAIFARSCNPGAGRGNYFGGVPGRSTFAEMTYMLVTDNPADLDLDAMRGPVIGGADNPIVHFLRKNPVRYSQLRVDALPSVIDIDSLPVNWSEWGRTKPTFEGMTSIFARFCGDIYAGWRTDDSTPDAQHPGYGSYLASCVSIGLLLLCSTAHPSLKRPLAEAMTLWGIDIAGAFADGRQHVVNNGHCAGRKALLVLAGWLIGGPSHPFCNPNAYLPGKPFQEDQMYVPQVWWTGEWVAGYSPGNGLDPSVVAVPPSDVQRWGSPVDPMHRGYAWALDDYVPHVVGAQVGTALAMKLLGTTSGWGEFAVGMVRQWMHGKGSEIDKGLRAAGIELNFGEDYSVAGGNGMCAAAWDAYAHLH